jgi:hypothetical protein
MLKNGRSKENFCSIKEFKKLSKRIMQLSVINLSARQLSKIAG